MEPLSSQRSSYDAVVVGGGVVGAVVAHKLASAGKSVLVLEAGTGETMDPDKYWAYIMSFYSLGAARSAPNSPYPPNLSALSPNDSAQHPYFIQIGEQRFLSDYLRAAGGSTLHWQGTSVRMVPNDFLLQSQYGRAVDWPITYDDLEPYYRAAEWEIGVSANVVDQTNFGVWFPEGYDFPMEGIPHSCSDQFFTKQLAAAGENAKVNLYGGPYPLRVIAMPTARNSTPRQGYKPVGAVGVGAVDGGRCQANASCSPICPVQAKYNAMKTLQKATLTGNVEIRSQCVATKLQIDPHTGRITGVEYKRYAVRGQAEFVRETVRGGVVVLAANAIENTVLALASGIVDRSGQLGRNLMDHPYIALTALAPEPVYPFRGPDITGGIETLRDGKFREKHAAFRASISNWGWPGEPGQSVRSLIGKGVYGRELRDRLQNRLTRMVRLGIFLEQLPDANNRVTIDPAKTDQLGNYLPILNYKYDEYSLDGALTVLNAFWPTVLQQTAMTDATDFTNVLSGFQAVTYRGQTFNMFGPGHIVGTHRMGRSANTSVIDTNLRSWAHPNLYMIGAGSMVTIGTSNPTLTASALALRASEQMLQDLA